MKDIYFTCYEYSYNGNPEKHLHFPPDKRVTFFQFYPNGKWDEDKLTLPEAIEKYPPHKFNWLKVSINGNY